MIKSAYLPSRLHQRSLRERTLIPSDMCISFIAELHGTLCYTSPAKFKYILPAFHEFCCYDDKPLQFLRFASFTNTRILYIQKSTSFPSKSNYVLCPTVLKTSFQRYNTMIIPFECPKKAPTDCHAFENHTYSMWEIIQGIASWPHSTSSENLSLE